MPESSPPSLALSNPLLAAWATFAHPSPQAMLAVDASGQVLHANPAAEQRWGTAGSLQGQRLDAALPLYGSSCEPPIDWHALLARPSNAESPPIALRVGLPLGPSRWFQAEVQVLGEGLRGLRLTDVDHYHRERERTQQSLRELQALSDTLDIHAIVSVTDLQGNILYVNPQFEAISGYSASELLGQTHRIVNSGLQPPEFWREMWDTVSQGLPWHGEVCNRAKDGSLYWVDSLIAPQLGADGMVERLISIRSNITHYKRTEKILAASRRILERTGHLAGVGGWFRDERSGTLYLSSECLALYGIDAQDWAEAVDAPGYFAFERDDPSLPAAAVALQTLRPQTDMVIEVDRADAGHRWLRLVADLETDEDDVTWLIGAMIDLTTVTLTQRRVLESERNFRTAIEALGEAFALFDPQERLVYCNEKYRKLYPNRTSSYWVGVRYEDLLRTEVLNGAVPMDADGAAVEAWVQDRLRRFRREHSDQIVQLRDGRWLREAERRTADGFHVSFRIDVTDMQRALQEADAASHSKTRFLAAMSHEIRTPMNAVLGMLKLLEYTELSDRQLELVDKSSRAARSLLDILNDILDFSKVEAGKMVLDPEPFVLEQLLSDLSPILSSTLGGKSLELVFDIDPALPPVLVGDVLRLKQVLINLLGNAIKFTSIGEVVLRIDQVAQQGDGVQVRFQVRDTGIGIAREQQSKVFSGFSQAEAFIARQFGGTGLGLSISQRLVELMGGTMSLQSTLGRGSTFGFEVTLGISAQHEPADEVSRLAPADRPKPLVWLYGCQASTAKALQRGLSALGCQVIVVQEATAPDPGTAPDLIVSESRIASPQAAQLAAWISHWAAQGQRVTWFQLVRGADVEASAKGHSLVQPDLHLVKPVSAGALWRTYCQRLEGDDTAVESSVEAALPAPARLQGLRLLLVEDNAFNQEVAQEMLQREGAEVVVAENGLVALNLLRDAAPFDLVLMDMQMPVMDGLQATQAIRRQGQRKGYFQTLPIVAMTANAMASDRQACLDAGMNAHIGKPFDLDQVVQVVLAQTGRRPLPALSAQPDEPMPPPMVVKPQALALFDPEGALRRLGGDKGFFSRMLRGYPDTLAPQMGELRWAVQQGNAAKAAGVLHRMKSSAASMGAEQLAEHLSSLEIQAKAGTTPQDLQALTALVQQVFAAQEAWLQTQVETAPATPAPPPPEHARADLPDRGIALESLDMLEASVRSSDMGVFDECADLEARFGAPLGIDTTALSAAVDNFDTPSALAAIRTIRQKLGANIEKTDLP